MTVGIVLAAGNGRRFGAQKLLDDLEGRPLVYYAVAAALGSRLDRVLVVLGDGSAEVEGEIRRSFPNEPRIGFVHNAGAALGMMTSLQAGITSLPPGTGAAVVMLADMPLVIPELIDRLVGAHEETGNLVVPQCGDEPRHPRVVPARFFPEFLSLEAGARGTVVFDRHPDETTMVPFDDATPFADVDTPTDLSTCAHALRARSSSAGQSAPHNAGAEPSNS
jgi:molybdenum cofactor cytidylyltransferase